MHVVVTCKTPCSHHCARSFCCASSISCRAASCRAATSMLIDITVSYCSLQACLISADLHLLHTASDRVPNVPAISMTSTLHHRSPLKSLDLDFDRNLPICVQNGLPLNLHRPTHRCVSAHNTNTHAPKSSRSQPHVSEFQILTSL